MTGLIALIPLAFALIQDESVVSAFERVSGLPHAVVLRRIPADEASDLVVALASAGPGWWNTKDRLGVFVQGRSDPGQIQALAIAPGPNDDCSTRIERFTAQELVLSCVGEKWSTYDNQKFVYDVAARKLVSHLSYPPFATMRVLRGPQFVMSDKQRQLLVGVDAATGEPRVLNAQAPEAPAEPGATFGRFRLSKAKNQYGSEYPVVVEGANVFALPQTDRKTWQRARPEDARSYLRLDAAEFNEQIGPHQVEGGRLWFGKTFYNSEGLTGLGGFGYFDAATASYQLISPPEIYAWSVSAILVEPECVWLALYQRGEYGNRAGGLLRWDRKTATVRRWEMPWIAVTIARSGDAIYLGTTDGIATLRGDRLTRYFVDRTATGRYQMVRGD